MDLTSRAISDPLALAGVLGLAVAVGLLPSRRASGPWTAWAWRVDLGLAAAFGLSGGLLAAIWLAPFAIRGGWGSSDLAEYCTLVATQAGGGAADLRTRSLLPGLPAVLLAPIFGVLDASGISAWGSMVVCASGLYLWGRAVHGRVAGACAALSTGLLPPLLVFSRDLGFYPEQAAVFSLGAAGAALALRLRSLPALALGTLGAGLCFLVDLRGLLWGVTFLGLVGIAALGAPARRWPLRLGLVALGIGLAWGAGRWTYGPQTAPLEQQADLAGRLQEVGLAAPAELQRPAPTAYVWGWSNPTQIPSTLLELRRRSALVPSTLAGTTDALQARRTMVDPWRGLAIGAAVLAALGLLRGREGGWRALALVGTLAPFLVALDGAIRFQQSSIRFLGQAAPALAMLIGVAWATASDGLREGGTATSRWPSPRPLLAVLLWLALVVGALPSPLSPAAAWRSPIQLNAQPILDLLAGTMSPGQLRKFAACGQSIQADRAEGREERLVHLTGGGP